MKDYLEALGLSALTVFLPIKAVMLTVGTLVFTDLISGILAARKRGEPITSAKLKRTVGKIFVYEVGIAVSFLVHQFLTGDLFPADKILASLIGLVELKSMLENLQTFTGDNVFQILIDRVSATEKKQEDETKK